MTVIYGNKSKLSNLEMVPVLKTAVARLERLKGNPLGILDAREDVFGQALDPNHDDVLADLLASVDLSHSDEFEDVLKNLLEGSLVVLNRQLKTSSNDSSFEITMTTQMSQMFLLLRRTSQLSFSTLLGMLFAWSGSG